MDDATAYFAWAVSYLRKMFIKLTTGAVVIKLFFFVNANKLDRLSLAKFFQALSTAILFSVCVLFSERAIDLVGLNVGVVVWSAL